MSRKVVHYWGQDSDMETLAAVARRNETPGVNFARIHANPDVPHERRFHKDVARSQVVGLFSRKVWDKPLSILTLPGITWRFERSLLRLREPEREKGELQRTFITALEREPPIFAAALKDIPGADQGIRHLPDDFAPAVCSLRTPLISRFHLCAFEEFAVHNTRPYDAAWLDFTGPLTDRLLETLPAFWRQVKHTMVVTNLNARWSRRISNKVSRAGGSANLLAEVLGSPAVLRTDRYMDGVPMIQSVFTRDPLPVKEPHAAHAEQDVAEEVLEEVADPR